MRLHANSPTRTKWICAASISDRSASQRDSGHCSGYHAAPSNSDGEYGVEGTCAATGTNKKMNKATLVTTFLSITVSSILPALAFLRFDRQVPLAVRRSACKPALNQDSPPIHVSQFL